MELSEDEHCRGTANAKTLRWKQARRVHGMMQSQCGWSRVGEEERSRREVRGVVRVLSLRALEASGGLCLLLWLGSHFLL